MGLFWIHVLDGSFGFMCHSHGFGWVSHKFMCLTAMDLDGSLIIHVSHSHGFGWVSFGFMCLTVMDLDGSLLDLCVTQSWIWMGLCHTVMDLDGSLLDSCVSQSWIWMGLFWIHVSHSHGFGWVSFGFMCLMDFDGCLIDSCVSQTLIWMGLS